MHLATAACNAQFSITQITVAHFVAEFTDPTKNWLPNLPLPNFPVAQFTVAQFSVAHFTIAQFTVYRLFISVCSIARYLLTLCVY